MTTKCDLNRWLDKLYNDDNLTHMIVACDEFDWSDYPVYVPEGESVFEMVEHYHTQPLSRVVEVYSKNHSREAQVAERRAFHYD